MFGIVYTAFVGIAKAIRAFGVINENEKNKNDAIKRNENTYCDHKGAIRLCTTGEHISRQMVNGEDCIVGDNNRIVRNLDQEKRNKNEEIYKKNKELAIKNGNTVYYTGWKRIYGYKSLKTYRDIKTDEEYCCIKSHGCGKYHYRRVRDGMFIRLADCEVQNGDSRIDKYAIKANEELNNPKIEIKYLFTQELSMDSSVPECGERIIDL